MRKIFIPTEKIDNISIDKVKKRDVIYVKHNNIPKGFVCVDEKDHFYIRYFNTEKTIEYNSLELLMKNFAFYTFYLIDN